ncbi:MAG TPA: hypothetical protein PL084_07895, partial [Chitinophagales bacterium]|nr:hypothetical protein [Chitinophagales bacterium]
YAMARRVPFRILCCEGFNIHVNLAKTFQDLATRIASKITAFTMIQYLNFFVFNRAMNKLKINLA